jgi:hypothetical protein
MLTPTKHIINKRSDPIPIKENFDTQVNANSPKGEYSLKQNFFDPTKSSPPNEFMLKLRMRMNKYYIDNEDVKFEIK